jgi:hypothetical protein
MPFQMIKHRRVFLRDSKHDIDPLCDASFNIMAMRADFHMGFDQTPVPIFTIMPLDGAFRVYWLSQFGGKFAADYHGRHVNLDERVTGTVLHARFAWAIILHARAVASLRLPTVPVPVTLSAPMATPKSSDHSRKRARISEEHDSDLPGDSALGGHTFKTKESDRTLALSTGSSSPDLAGTVQAEPFNEHLRKALLRDADAEGIVFGA